MSKTCNTTTEDVVAFSHGDTTYDVQLITKKDRLLCPKNGCRNRFDTETGLRQHLTQYHNITATFTTTCKQCGEKFTRNEERTFCSQECTTTYRHQVGDLP